MFEILINLLRRSAVHFQLVKNRPIQEILKNGPVAFAFLLTIRMLQ